MSVMFSFLICTERVSMEKKGMIFKQQAIEYETLPQNCSLASRPVILEIEYPG